MMTIWGGGGWGAFQNAIKHVLYTKVSGWVTFSWFTLHVMWFVVMYKRYLFWAQYCILKKSFLKLVLRKDKWTVLTRVLKLLLFNLHVFLNTGVNTVCVSVSTYSVNTVIMFCAAGERLSHPWVFLFQGVDSAFCLLSPRPLQVMKQCIFC